MGGCGCIVYLVLVWHCIDIFVFGDYNYMAVANSGLYFCVFGHQIFPHLLCEAPRFGIGY
jgi:hypothetical protein